MIAIRPNYPNSRLIPRNYAGMQSVPPKPKISRMAYDSDQYGVLAFLAFLINMFFY